MPSAAKPRGEKGQDRVADDFFSEKPRAQTKNIGVVMLACEPRRGGVPSRHGPNAVDLVRRDRNTHSRAADEDAQAASASHLTGDFFGKNRIVARARVVGSEILDEESRVGVVKVLLQRLFRGKARVIGSQEKRRCQKTSKEQKNAD